MKKSIVFVLLALSLLFACAMAEEEAVYTFGDFEYALLENGDAELIRYNGPEGEVIIPDNLDGHPLTAVRGNPFAIVNSFYGDVDDVKVCNVTVSRSHPYLATIDGVLFGKTDRRLIYCPSALHEGPYAVPDGIAVIGDCAFYRCTGLTSVSIPDSVTEIGAHAFSLCSSLSSVDIPDGVGRIADSAFSFSGLVSVTIPAVVTSIGAEAFCGCSGLATISIPDSVTLIGRAAFSMCVSLTELVLPDSVTEIADWAFMRCIGLASVTLPAGLTSIGEGLFLECGSLTSVILPDGVASIGSDAFAYISGPLSVTVPASVTAISDQAFGGCENLTLTVTRGSYADSWCVAHGVRCLYDDDDYGDDDSWL